MEQFIALKQDAEFWLTLLTLCGVFLWVGYAIGEHEKHGGKISDLWHSVNKTRALMLLKKMGK